LEKRKKRKLKPSEVLSEERIVEAITLLNNNCILLDSPLEGWNDVSGEIKTFSDIIADNQPTVEEEILAKNSRQELISLIKTHLDPVLWNIIVLRYLDDIPKSHEEVAEYLYVNKITKKRMSKEATRQKEIHALKKLKTKDKEGVLKTLLRDSIATRNKMEDQ
jgi:DNA-directed RNA polymerase sigma subunit (sigma70/sigma32)